MLSIVFVMEEFDFLDLEAQIITLNTEAIWH
jgi:hypothetical protein